MDRGFIPRFNNLSKIRPCGIKVMKSVDSVSYGYGIIYTDL